MPHNSLRNALLTTTMAVTFLLPACSDDSAGPTDSSAPVATVEIALPSTPVPVGAVLQLAAVTRSATGRVLQGRTIVWSSSDTTVIKMSGNGMLVARSAGVASITASSEGHSDTVQIPVSTTNPANSLQLALISYLGGSNEIEVFRDVATDAQGNVYLAGGSNSPDFPVTADAFDVTFNNPGSNAQDAVVMKLSPSGQVLWSTYVGGPGYDRAYAVEVDAQGFVYIAGRAGTGFPVTAGALQTSFGGGDAGVPYGTQDGFVCKLTPDGSAVVFCTYFGADDVVPVRDIAIDASGSIYVATTANRDPGLPLAAFANTYQKNRAGGRDVLLAKLNTDGALQWATYVGGSSGELNTATVRLDALGNVYVVTTTQSADCPTPNGFDKTFGGTSDFYLAKLSPDGSQLLYGTYLGGSGNDFTETHELWVTPSGEAVVIGMTTSPDFPVTPGAFQTNYGGSGGVGTGAGTNYSGDAIVARISTDGSQLLAATFLGGRNGDGAEGVFVDAFGDIYVSGTTYSSDFPVTDASHPQSGASDMFGVKLSGDLARVIYGVRAGGSGAEESRSAIVDVAGNMYFVGATESNNFPVLSALQATRKGLGDASIVKLAPAN